jgi:hypothetical protein
MVTTLKNVGISLAAATLLELLYVFSTVNERLLY